MKNFTFLLSLILFTYLPIFAGHSISNENDEANALAMAALVAHGGEKLKSMKSLVLKGSAEVAGSPTATFPAGFTMIFSGDRYLLEISNPFQPLKQVFDGEETYSSLPGFRLPPVNRLGLPMLQRINDAGFKVEVLPEKSRKKKGFRIVSPDGFFCDFFVDSKTGAVKAYESDFDVNGRVVSTSVEIDSLSEVEGIKIPKKYSQRFELGGITIYTSFNAAQILVNSNIEDSVFSLR